MPHRNPFKPMKDRPELSALLERAAMHVMTPQEIAAQRRSWVIGEMMLEHPEMSRERAIEIYESVASPDKSKEVTMITPDVLENMIRDVADKQGRFNRAGRTYRIIEPDMYAFCVDLAMKINASRKVTEPA